MNEQELRNRVESVLFSLGKRLSLDELSKLCKEYDHEKLKAALNILGNELEEKKSSLMLVQEGVHYKLAVREQYLPIIRKVVKKTELRKGVLETLSVVAFKAPVLQSKVIAVRTNKAYDHLRQLEETGYISREKSGRTKLIKLTQKFFDYFDTSIEKLKGRFGNAEQLEEAMNAKEAEVAEEEGTPEKLGELKVVDLDKETHVEDAPESPVEVYSEQLGDLEVYKAKRQHKKKEEPEEQPEEPAEEKKEPEKEEPEEKPSEEKEPVEESPEEKEEQLEELTPESEEKPEEEKEPVEESPEEAKEPEEKEEQPEEPTPESEEKPQEEEKEEEKTEESDESTEEEPRKFEGKGLFADGMPEHVQTRVDKRVAEIVGEPTPAETEEGNEPTEEKEEQLEELTPESEEKPEETPPEEEKTEE